MPYRKTYRGEFDNTLPGIDNAAATQTIRVDIADVSSGQISSTSVIDNATFGFASYGFLMVANGSGSTYDELVTFFTGGNGKAIRVSGSGASDGDYIITSDPVFTPPTSLPTFGYVNFNINIAPAGGVAGADGITIEDITTGSIIQLKMAGDPLHIATIDNNEDKFTTVRAKQAIIQIHTDGVIDINTFAEADDGNFYVEIFVDTLIILRGYLVIPDMDQEFLPHPNILRLLASDGLGTLKDIELVNDEDASPQADSQIIKYIAWALRLTGIEQNINVINSVRHGSGELVSDVIFDEDGGLFKILTPATDFFYPGQRIRVTGTASNDGEYTVTGSGLLIVQITLVEQAVTDETVSGVLFEDISSEMPFYEAVYLDSRTFEKEVGSLEDCYTVLSKILAEDSVLFQQNGEWYVLRIDDIQGDGAYSVDRFDSEGVYINTISIDRLKLLGKPDVIQWMDDSCKIIPDRAYKEIRETYKYDTPKETICNVDFSRGDFISDLPDETVDSIVYNAKSFNLDNWTLGRYERLDPTPGASTTTSYIERLYQFGYEKERFAAVGFTTAATPYEYIRSCPININKADKFSFSVDFKFSADGGGDDIPVVGYLLYGDDGNVYEWVDAGVWNNMTTFIAGNPAFNFIAIESSQFDYNGGVKTEWNTFSSNMLPAPVGGILYIYLTANYTIPSGFIFYENITFTYAPFINGSYQKYSGQQHSVSQTVNNKALRDNQVFISDSPSLIFKGALKVFDGTSRYILTRGFMDANHTSPVPFGELQAYAVWNQYRKSNRNFDGSVDLMESDVVDGGLYDGADLLHKYKLTDSNDNTNNRLFMVLHYDMDFNLLEWKTYIASLYRTDIGKVYTDEHIFKYISS